VQVFAAQSSCRYIHDRQARDRIHAGNESSHDRDQTYHEDRDHEGDKVHEATHCESAEVQETWNSKWSWYSDLLGGQVMFEAHTEGEKFRLRALALELQTKRDVERWMQV
jgi:hypothetical protein